MNNKACLHLLAMEFHEAITGKDRDGMLHWIRMAAQPRMGLWFDSPTA